MCTLIIARNLFRFYPLVIAANRDERLHRPSAGPARLHGNAPTVLAPRDAVFGGTWLGVNASGVASAITNRDTVEHARGRVSRGMLAHTALKCRTAAEAISRVIDFGGKNFNGFHLAVMDREDGYLLLGDGNDIVVRPLEDGLTIVTASGYGPEHSQREMRLRSLFRKEVRNHPPRPSTFAPLLNLHDLPHSESGETGACLHGSPDDDWVTKSSSLIRVQDRKRNDGSLRRFWEFFHRERTLARPNCGSPWSAYELDLE